MADDKPEHEDMIEDFLDSMATYIKKAFPLQDTKPDADADADKPPAPPVKETKDDAPEVKPKRKHAWFGEID